MKKSKHELFQNILLVVLGNFLLASAVQMFVLPYNILSGGVAGVSVALYPLLHIDPDILINILVYGLFILGFLVLGKDFAMKTFFSSFIYPIFISFLSNRVPIIDIDPILASVYGGVIAGMGIGLTLRAGASSGGMDIPPLIIHKFTNIPLSTLILIVDALTVILGLFTYGLEEVLIGLISVYTSAIAIDKVITMRGNIAKEVKIISDKYEEISQRIQDELGRGTTLLHGEGGYTRDKKRIVLVIVDSKQYTELMKIIDEIDSDAFVFSSDTTEVKGEGFTFGFKI